VIGEDTTGLFPRMSAMAGNGNSQLLAGSSDRLRMDRRRTRRQAMLIAPLLMLAGASGAVYLASQHSGQVDAVALAHPLQRGQVVTADDLATVRVSAEGGQVRLSTTTTSRRDVVGKAALVDLPAGTLMTPELVAAGTPPPNGVTVGVRLAADAMPAAHLRSSEWVRVVHTDSTSGEASVVASHALVLSVTAVSSVGGGDTDTVVYLSVPNDSAAAVAGAASSRNGVRLLGVRP
jgi:hypothetical protein